MDEKFICYCGLYCENCGVKARIEPAAAVLYREMKLAGFAEIIDMIPKGADFWAFLKYMAEVGACVSCRDGSGNPGCAIRLCARGKDLDMCAFCESYPCDKFAEMFASYPVLRSDNALLRDKGMAAWGRLQDERRAKGFAYSDMKTDECGTE